MIDIFRDPIPRARLDVLRELHSDDVPHFFAFRVHTGPTAPITSFNV